MPTYYSVKGKQGLEFRAGGYAEIEDPVLGKRRVVAKPLMVRFEELHPPIQVYGLPGRDGLARGILTPEMAVAQIRTRAAEFGGSPDKLDPDDEKLASWVIQKLTSHPQKGALFVEIADADETLEGGPVGDHLSPLAGMVTSPIAGVMVKAGNRVHCQVCDRTIFPQGINGHSRSKAHIANLRAYEKERREAAA